MIEVKGSHLRMEGSEDEVESQVAAVLAGYTRFLHKNYPPCVAKEKLDNVIKLGSFTDVENDTEEYVDSTASEPEAKPEPEQGKEEAPVIEQSQTTQQNPAAAALFS